ncbi:MAG: LrgB family protein [Bacteroidales bacterium]|jgi:predicted murein hydrolase (TIGR00659 family)
MENKFILESLFIILSVVSYMLGKFIYSKSRLMLLHTIIVATILVILALRFVKVEIHLYQQNTEVLRYLLNLSIVALGYLLYKHYDYIKNRGVAIFSATFIGSLTAILSVGLLAILFGAKYETIVTLLPKSITTPIAIVISEQYGGSISLTAMIVVIAGIFGAIVGPWFLKFTGINSRLATGLALGSAAHGIGTAKALETGALEGAAGGLAIALMGLFTSILIPLIVPFIKIVLSEI